MNPLLKLWHLAEFAAAQTLILLLGVAPMAIVQGFAGLAARIAFFVWRSRRRVAIENLLRAGLCADESAARRMALGAFRNFTLMVAESIVARRRIHAENWRQFVELKLSPEAERLLREPGRGLLVADDP